MAVIEKSVNGMFCVHSYDRPIRRARSLIFSKCAQIAVEMIGLNDVKNLELSWTAITFLTRLDGINTMHCMVVTGISPDSINRPSADTKFVRTHIRCIQAEINAICLGIHSPLMVDSLHQKLNDRSTIII